MSRHSLDLTAGANARCSPHSYRWMASLPATSPSPQRSDGAMPCLAAPCTGCCSRLPFAAMAPSHRAPHPANILLRRGSADVLTAMLGQMYIIFHATAARGVRQTLPCRPALQQCLVCLVLSCLSIPPSIHPSHTSNPAPPLAPTSILAHTFPLLSRCSSLFTFLHIHHYNYNYTHIRRLTDCVSTLWPWPSASALPTIADVLVLEPDPTSQLLAIPVHLLEFSPFIAFQFAI
jgi:hypothetical protein